MNALLPKGGLVFAASSEYNHKLLSATFVLHLICPVWHFCCCCKCKFFGSGFIIQLVDVMILTSRQLSTVEIV